MSTTHISAPPSASLSPAKQRPREGRQSFRALNGLRFFAALAVICFHYLGKTGGFAATSKAVQNLVDAGPVALGFFYILSGFVLAHAYGSRMPLTREARRRFWLARVARLYPVYLLAFLLFLPMAYEKYIRPPGMGSHGLGTFATAGLLNLTVVQAWTPLSQSWNGPSWSLSVEAFFYLLFPFLLQPLLFGAPRRILPMLAAAWVLMVSLPWMQVHGLIAQEVWQRWIENDPLFWTPMFMLGIASYRLQPHLAHLGSPVAALASVSTLSLLLFVCAAATPAWREILISGGAAPLLASIVLFCSHDSNVTSRALGTRLLYQAGAVSYIIYILQSPVWNIVHAIEAKLSHAAAPPSRLAFAVFVAVLLSVALLVEQGIEKPAQRWLLRRWEPGRRGRPAALPIDPGSEAV